MKTEAEVRAHRDALRTCMEMPCQCAGTEHEASCLVGLKMMEATMEMLSWVLGENDDLQRLVDRMRLDASLYRRNLERR